MKRKLITAALLSLFITYGKAQIKDSSYRIRKIQKFEITEIDLYYNQYAQYGSNSAVTGGIGTEKLNVYAPGFQISHSKNTRVWQLKGGTDIITSASTDKIDNIVSSASIMDARTHMDFSYGIKKRDASFILGTGFSIESDYFSLPLNFAFNHISNDKRLEQGLNFQSYFDDLRWGRLNPTYRKPVKLIYPVELRYSDWFENKKRNSFTLKYHLSYALNRKTLVGGSLTLTNQIGLLSTPFHRVYFKDSSLRVERLPDLRNKLSLAFRLNRYLGLGMFNRTTIEGFTDDWGIRSLAIENELAIKLGRSHVLTPFFRIFLQKKTRYFEPYRTHELTAVYYTSDYDLSDLKTIKLGLGYKLNQGFILYRRLSFKVGEIRYSYYVQNNGLYAHVCSLNLQFESKRKIESKN